MRAVTAVAICLILAGCSDAPASGPDPQEPLPDDPTTADALPEVETPAPWAATYYLSGGGLVADAPADGSSPLKGFASAMATNQIGALFRTDAWPTPVHVAPQEVRVTLVVGTDTAAVGNPAFDLAAWFGTSRGESGFSFVTTGPLAPGAREEVIVDLDLSDHPGIVLPAGESFHVRVADSFEPGGQGRIFFGAEGSRVEFRLQNLTDDPFAAAQQSTQAFSGQVTGGAFVECSAAEDAFMFTVGENASWVSLQVDGTSPSPGPLDIDLDLLEGPTTLWHAGSPTAQDEILLAGPALMPYIGRELAARASMCVGGYADYEITIASG